MNLENKIDTLNEVADIVGGEMYERYSGRGMYGAQCYGIVCDDPIPCIENAAENGIKGAVYDQMGLHISSTGRIFPIRAKLCFLSLKECRLRCLL